MTLPQNWPEYRVEIDALLSSYYPNYQERVYLKPVYYVSGIHHDPGLYPILSRIPVKVQKRYISLFLKEQGRISRGAGGSGGKIWMFPEVAV